MGCEQSVGCKIVWLNEFDHDIISAFGNLGFKDSLGRTFVGEFDDIFKLNIAIRCRKRIEYGERNEQGLWVLRSRQGC